MNWNAKWIMPAADFGEAAPVFFRNFKLSGKIAKATLELTAIGVYEAVLNEQRVSSFVLAPGWTTYRKRLQVQTYEITDLLKEENELTVTVGKGWYRSRYSGSGPWPHQEPGMTARIVLEYADGGKEVILSDEAWRCGESAVRFSEIYDGEIYDATWQTVCDQAVEVFDGPTETLIPQEGEEVHEQERFAVARMFTAPNGELILDFGQEVTGYVVSELDAHAGEALDLSFAEVLDRDGNFYTGNYRSAKCQYHYICRDGKQTYKPKLTFWGFRYVRVNAYPGGLDKTDPAAFTAVAVYSDMKRTGWLRCSNPKLNRLFDNILWGQRDNFLDVPTDCPQRDERLGWTGDAQAFVRTACLNYDVEKFFTKWLGDLAADQFETGSVSHMVPDTWRWEAGSAAWGDAATICPWTVYLAYGNPEILRRQFASMKKWVDYITNRTTTPGLWTGDGHYGDWLGLDAPEGSYKGSSDQDLIASAYYAYSTSIVVKAGRILGEDVSAYEELHEKIVRTFRETFTDYKTQAECVVAAYFGLAADCQAAADKLVELINGCGGHLMTGFVGTPYLLHVLSRYGHADVAYSLLLREEYPSWLYAVNRGATTIWEHWDSLREDGSFWSDNMNSFNHYAYGSVADWVYMVAAGIQTVEEAPGYEKIRIAPHPDARLDWLEAKLETRHGLVSSVWKKENGLWHYEITTPSETEIVIDGKCQTVAPGTWSFQSKI